MSNIVIKHQIIPNDWNIIKIKDFLNEIKYGSSKKLNTEGEGILSLGIPNIIQGEINLEFKRYSEINDTELDKYLLNDGEILIVRTNANPDYIGRCALFEKIKEQTIFTSYLIKIRIENEKVLPKFLTYYLQSNISRRQFKMRARTSAGNYNLSIPEIKSIEVVLPPIPEQQKIIFILSNVDKLILTTQHLIENLQILKKGLMQRLFTEGIGHTEFKETKLGKIPKEWEIKSLNDVISMINSGTWGDDPEEGEGIYPVLRSTEIKYDGRIDLSTVEYRAISQNNISKCILDNDDILIVSSSGSPRLVGRTAYFIKPDKKQIYLFSNFMLRLRPSSINPKYLYYFLNSGKYKRFLNSLQQTATGLRNLPKGDLVKLKIPYPNSDEQNDIAQIFFNIDEKIENEKKIKKKLKKIKKGLMQDLLTGKKRVKIN